MEEKDAIELLGKLEKFMKDTNESIKNLIIGQHNVRVDVEKLKKLIADKNKIIIPH